MGIQHFRLPDVGEGLVEAEIVSWKVKPGDTVKLNDTIVEIETAKSLVELPVPFAGVVTELLVPEGETVPVGTPIISVQTDSAEAAEALADDMVPSVPEPEESGGRTAVLVGYGPKTTEAKRRARKPAASAGSAPAPAAGGTTAAATAHAVHAPTQRRRRPDGEGEGPGGWGGGTTIKPPETPMPAFSRCRQFPHPAG